MAHCCHFEWLGNLVVLTCITQPKKKNSWIWWLASNSGTLMLTERQIPGEFQARLIAKEDCSEREQNCNQESGGDQWGHKRRHL